MYLSCLLIDVGDNPDHPRPGRLWLRNLYHVHQRLCMAFPSEQRIGKDPQFLEPWDPADFPEQRHLADRPTREVGPDVLRQVHSQRDRCRGFLFRIDPQPCGRAVILVQSGLKPDWGYAFQNASYLLAAPPEAKSFDPCFGEGECFRFRLVANPTRKIDTKSGPDRCRRNGRRVPVPTDQLYEWLALRAEAAGFSVDKDSITIQPGYIYVSNPRNGNGQRLRSAQYDGTLRITNAPCFQETVVRGIGSAKAFGFGLLSLARV